MVDRKALVKYLEEMNENIRKKKARGDCNYDFINGKHSLCVALLEKIKNGEMFDSNS